MVGSATLASCEKAGFRGSSVGSSQVLRLILVPFTCFIPLYKCFHAFLEASKVLRMVCEADPCLVAVQSRKNCYHFASGAALSELRPLGKELCLRSKRVYAALATANHSEVVVAWDPERSDGSRPYSCLGRVTFPSMQLMNSLAVDLVASVVYDRAAGSVEDRRWT